MKDYLIKAIDTLGRIRVYVADTTELVQKMHETFGTSATASAAMGRLITATAMISSTLKNDTDVCTITVDGGGSIGKVVAVGKSDGRVKICADNPQADMVNRPDGKLNVGGIVGTDGHLTVITDHGLKEPYVGRVPLVSGEIGEDIASYYHVSEQIASAVGLGVLVNPDLSIKAAGGFIVQLLPLIREDEITFIEEALSQFKSITALIESGLTPEEILAEMFSKFDMEILDKCELKYECDCSRERIEKVLISLGEDELNAMIKEDDGAQLVCHFCNTAYDFNSAELTKLVKEAKK